MSDTTTGVTNCSHLERGVNGRLRSKSTWDPENDVRNVEDDRPTVRLKGNRFGRDLSLSCDFSGAGSMIFDALGDINGGMMRIGKSFGDLFGWCDKAGGCDTVCGGGKSGGCGVRSPFDEKISTRVVSGENERNGTVGASVICLGFREGSWDIC